ncbi:hypothetical protein BDY17DRAFT_323895 [Neohortaea acidophila]|uniref:Uncharacterized protein n=1 Tax=Neohortaea acidophila TaxID=245834 RepID=A0A6A6PTC4_9PEZI|nr:uncharacterized protein BDY17DRAFT_323895 [Neohortaea acidophila]KAF2483135.1 hypothetical protein BDY17DRAFT_323895 [Neohortaea acidophila]
MSSQSNVGNSQVYEAGDQRNVSKEDEEQIQRFHEGQDNAHKANDAKDERTIANKLERETQREKEKDEPKTEHEAAHKIDATLPAKLKGNKPSRGAEIDQELREEEEAILKKKGDFGPNVN